MRGVNVGSGCVVTPGAFGGVGDATTLAGLGGGAGVLIGWAGTGVGAGRLIGGTGVGGGAPCALLENVAVSATSVRAHTPNAVRRIDGRYTFAICEMRHVRACLCSTQLLRP